MQCLPLQLKGFSKGQIRSSVTPDEQIRFVLQKSMNKSWENLPQVWCHIPCLLWSSSRGGGHTEFLHHHKSPLPCVQWWDPALLPLAACSVRDAFPIPPASLAAASPGSRRGKHGQEAWEQDYPPPPAPALGNFLVSNSEKGERVCCSRDGQAEKDCERWSRGRNKGWILSRMENCPSKNLSKMQIKYFSVHH